MNISWEMIATTLNLDVRQAKFGKNLIDRGKDRCLELWGGETNDYKPAPANYAASLWACSPTMDDEARSNALIKYLSTNRMRHGDASYLQVQFEYESSIKGSLKWLFNDEQWLGFEGLRIGSLLLDIDTGYDPIGDRIAILMSQPSGDGASLESWLAPLDQSAEWSLSFAGLELFINGVTRPGVDWKFCCEQLGMEPETEVLMRFALDRLQDECAELWKGLAADCALSPLEYLADLRLKGSDEQEVERLLIAYISETKTLGGVNTYLQAQIELERAVYRECALLLDRVGLERLKALSTRSFLNFDTGHRKIASELGKLLDECQLKRGIDIFCAIPFEFAYIENSGDVLPCCPSKFRLSIGNLKLNSLDEVWNSQKAEAVRDSIHDKTFRFCDFHACEYLKASRRKNSDRGTVPAGFGTSGGTAKPVSVPKARLPKVINLAYDKACNLACSYCRTELFHPSHEIHEIGLIHKHLFSQGIQGVERLIISGNGDVFASRYYMDFLQNFSAYHYPNVKIKLQTNGLLLTRERWERISKSHAAIDWISVSVDAATAGTYAVNRGGNFDRLLECLELVRELRQRLVIKLFYINFVVQANNFREMKRFVEIGETYGCDLVEFQCIENWGTYSGGAFEEVAIQHPSHPEHGQFREILDDPVFSRPIVYLNKILEFAPEHVRGRYGKSAVIRYQTAGAAYEQQ